MEENLHCWWNCSSLIQVDTWTGHLESLPSNSLTGIGNIDVVVVWRARWAEHLNLCVDSGKLRRLIPPGRWESWPLLLHWLQRHLYSLARSKYLRRRALSTLHDKLNTNGKWAKISTPLKNGAEKDNTPETGIETNQTLRWVNVRERKTNKTSPYDSMELNLSQCLELRQSY